MKSKHIRKVLLLVAITILLVGLASAATTNKTNTNKDTKIIKDNTKNIKTTTAKTKKATTKTVTSNKTQTNKVKEKTSEKKTHKIEKIKQKNTKTKTEIEATSWNDLQSIIGDISENTTIKLEEGSSFTTTQTIRWYNQDYTLTIDGNGQTINGDQKQLFFIYRGSTLVLKNITITNAQAEQGGAIYNEGTLTITDSTFINNQATGEYSYPEGPYGNIETICDTYGGAIYNSGILTITHSTLENNKATAITAPSMYGHTDAWGGAICNDGGTLTITDSTLTNNQVTTEICEWSNGNARGGAICNNRGTLTIKNTTLNNNNANAKTTDFHSNADAMGGAIYNLYGTYNITDTKIYKNTPANFIINETNNIQLVNEDNYISIVNFSIIADGKEIGNGTSVNNLTQFTISDEYDNVEIIINGTDEKTTNNHYVLKSNIANVTNYTELVETIDKIKTEKYNSYIINLHPGNYNATTSIDWDESATKNLIINGYNNTLNGKQEHQFIQIGSGLNLTLNNITITNYTTTVNGGVIFQSSKGILTIINSTFSKNTAKRGGVIYANGLLIVKDSFFLENQATGDELVSSGGAINGVDIDIFNSTFTNNTSIIGGAILGFNVNISICNLTENDAKLGGAIYIERTLNVSDSYFIQNTANGEGGAIYVQGHSGEGNYYCENVGNHFEGNRATTETIYFKYTFTKIIKDNTYKNTTIGYNDFVLNIDSSKIEFLSTETLPLKISASLLHPDWYDENIPNQLTYNVNIKDTEKFNVTNTSFKVDLINYKGKYTANVYNDIFQTSNNVEFTVLIPTSINMKIIDNTMGNVIINVDVKDINNGHVTSGVLNVYNDDNEIASIQLKGKSETITLDLDKGGYTLKFEYKPENTDYYVNTTLTKDITVTSATSMTLTNITNPIYVGDEIVLNGTLKDTKGRGLNTNITVTINNKKETVKVTDGNFQVKYTPTQEETVKIIAAFTGDKYNLQSNTTNTFKVQKINTKLTLAKVKNIYVGDKITLNITLTDNNGNKIANKTVQVQINNESTTFTTDKKGNIVYSKDSKDAGTFKITVAFKGDNQYNQSDNVTQTFKVQKIKTSITIKSKKIQNMDKVKLVATVKNQNNKKLNTGKVIFKINGITIKDKNGKVITAKVSKGQATLTFTPNKNYYNKVSNITAVYSENNKYQRSENNAKLTLKQRDAKIKLQSTKLKATQYDTITIKTISKDKNKAIKEGYVIFKINGKTLTKNGKTIKAKIKNGKATLKYNLNGHKTGKYTLTAVLSSNTYKKVTSKTTLKVTEDKIHIVAKAVKTSTNKTRIKAKILDTKNKYIKTTIKVSFKIDQKTVAKQVKVKNGKINVKIPTKVSKGKHTLNIVAGPNYRYKVTRKNVSLIKT